MQVLNKEQIDIIKSVSEYPEKVDELVQALFSAGFTVKESVLMADEAILPGKERMTYTVTLGYKQFPFIASLSLTNAVLHGKSEERTRAENLIVWQVLCDMGKYTYIADSYQEYLEEQGMEDTAKSRKQWRAVVRFHRFVASIIPEHLWDAMPL